MFTTQLTVTIDHINYGNHLAHDKLITMMHEARLRLLDSLNSTEIDFFGVGLIMKSLTINYRQEAFRGEVLSFVMSVNELRGAGFSLCYEVFNEQAEPIADAQVVMVGFDYHNKCVTRFSDSARQALMSLQHAENTTANTTNIVG